MFNGIEDFNEKFPEKKMSNQEIFDYNKHIFKTVGLLPKNLLHKGTDVRNDQIIFRLTIQVLLLMIVIMLLQIDFQEMI